MPKNAKRKSNEQTGNKNANKQEQQALEAHQLLPDYQPLDLSAVPQHMEILNKKIRNTKKRLRKIAEVEQAVKDGKKKKITKEQEEALANKQFLERNLADFEEIKTSMEKLDLSIQLRLVSLLFCFFYFFYLFVFCVFLFS